MTEIEEICENKMPDAIKYALNIIHSTRNFMEFAIALTDYMGIDFIPYCKSVFLCCISMPFISIEKFNNLNLESISNADIETAYKKFLLEQQEKKREQEFKENIDELQFLIQNYRKSGEFQKMLDFIAKFNYLAPYNAMLVQMQKPGATFVFNGKKWQEYGRRPKINAQNLIILRPFGPVQCVFDYSDTEPIPNATKVIEETQLLELWNNDLQSAKGDIENEIWDRFINNLSVYGIYLDDKFRAANTYGGYIMKYEDKYLDIVINQKLSIRVASRFIISVNENQNRCAKFHTICHELGHLFCHHQTYNDSSKRHLTLKEREFEAETVAWLVCKRLGIYNPSERYLASYSADGEIPLCSTDMIMKAVAEIEKMLESVVKIKDSFWYKEDKNLRETIKEMEKRFRTPSLFNQ